jgi:peroxiredoxin
MRNLLKAILLTAVFFLGSFESPVSAHQQAFENMGITKSKTEKPAPDFSLQDINGNKVSLEDFRGKSILLNFWATWCQACKEELPSMQRLHEALSRKGIEVVAISIDRNNLDRIKEFAKDYKLTFPILWDPDQKVRKHYYIMGLPTTYLIDPEGKLRGFASGAREWDSADAIQALSSLKGKM